jgi:hypothetical protein
MSAALTPGDQGRDWRRRWEEVQRELADLLVPHSERLSGDAIHAAAYRVQSFFIQAYHLKDALKADESAHGVPGTAIETAITNDADLALLADLANLGKHLQLTKPPRSGNAPAVGPARGVTSTSQGADWQLAMTITHAGKTLNGLDVARAAVDAWQHHLSNWGLI